MNDDKILESEYNAVYRYALSLCKNEHKAEDLTQNAFLRLLEKDNAYEGRSTLFTYLCAIVKNSFFSERKSAYPASELDENECSADKLPDEAVADSDASSRIFSALHALDEPYREVFYLRVFGELSFAKIAELFGKTESWARVTFYRGKMKITDIIK